METINVSEITPLLKQLSEKIIQFGLNFLIAIALLCAGFWLANRITQSLRKIMQTKHVDPSLQSFLTSLFSVILKILVVVIVLMTVGIEMTSIVAVLGAASLAIGMALSGTLQNFAGGVVILLFKPFKVGDFIETQSGYSGTVLEIFIFTTRLKTVDNKIVYLPNGALSNGAVTNYNEEGVRRIDCTFHISYGDDVTIARGLLMEFMAKDSRVHQDPAPIVYVQSLLDNGIQLLVRFWVDTGNIAPVQYELNEKVYQEFVKHGLHFPFPQIDIHMDKKLT